MKPHFLSLMLSITLITFIVAGNSLAANEAVISDLQADVTTTKTTADKNKADIESLKGGLPAEVEARIAGDANLQLQIDSIELTRGLCDIEIRIKLTVPNFPIRQECIPPAPEAPVLTELTIQTDGVTASLQLAGNATPNTILVPYVGDACQQSLSEFFSALEVTGDFDIPVGPDPAFDVEFSLPPTVIPYIGVIPSLAPFWTARSIDALEQISECSVDAIGIVVNNQ